MNNPADTLAATLRELAKVIRKYGTCAPAALEEVADRVAALASLKGEAEPVAWGRWAEGLPKGSRLMRYDGKPLVDHEPSEYFNVALYTTPPAPQAVEENAGDIPDIGELTPERIEYLAGAVNAAWCKSDMMVRAKRCQQAAQALRMLAAKLHPTPSPAPQGGGEAVAWMIEWNNPEWRGIRSVSLDRCHPDDGTCRPLIYGDTTPPAQQPGEVGEIRRVIEEMLMYASTDDDASRLERLSQYWADALTAALAPKEKGNG